MNHLNNPMTLCCILILLVGCHTLLNAQLPTTRSSPTTIPATQPGKLARINDPRLDESSGLARSQRAPGIWWTHNDSGDSAGLYPFHLGQWTGSTFLIDPAIALDWEDMAGFTQNGQPYLLIADTGDNYKARGVVTLYIIKEPDPLATNSFNQIIVPVQRKIAFVYPNGPHDCEAVVVDAPNKTIWLFTKSYKTGCEVYRLPLTDHSPVERLTAERVMFLPIKRVSAAALSPDGRRLILGAYSRGYLFDRGKNQSWQQALQDKPKVIPFPKTPQCEAVDFDTKGNLWLTSEKVPMRFGFIKLPPMTDTHNSAKILP